MLKNLEFPHKMRGNPQGISIFFKSRKKSALVDCPHLAKERRANNNRMFPLLSLRSGIEQQEKLLAGK